jgi:hypothetical protein
MARATKRASGPPPRRPSQRKHAAATGPSDDGKVEVRNVNVPGHVRRLDAARYHAMRKALLRVLPRKAPGLTQREMGEAVRAAAPDFLGSHMWWMKSVQLDLEAKDEVVREKTKPLRWHRPPRSTG